MPKYKYILWDMDGTTAYTDDMIIHTFWDLYDMYNPSNKKSAEELLYFSGPPLKVTLPIEFPNHDFKFIHSEFLRISGPYYDKYVVAFEHEVEVLSELYNAGYRFAIVTNKGTGKAHYVLKLLGIEHLFDFVIGSDDVKETKPDPEGINEAMKRFNAQIDECLYVGDNDIDYETATNAGVDCMICNWGPRKLNVLDKAKYVVGSYLDIKEVLL